MSSGSAPGRSVRPQPFQEQGVPRDEVVAHDEALAPWGVARGVQQPHADAAHLDDVTVTVRYQGGHRCA